MGSNPAARAGTELAVPGRDLAVDAQRRTAGERFSQADYDLMMRGVPRNTRLALARAWKKVLRFTGDHGFVECPMPVETCVKLIRWAWTEDGRYGRPLSPETVKHMLWAITKAHKVARRPDGVRGYVTPVASEEVNRAMRGYRDDYARARHRPDMATPIDPDEQLDMVSTCDVRSPVGLRDALALALLYDAGFRAGELVATADTDGLMFEDINLVATFNEPVDWTRPADIGAALDPQRDRLIIHVPLSKTDREGYGDEVVLFAHPPEYAANCPVRLFIAWRALLRERDLRATGPVLRQVLYGGKPPADGRPRKATVADVGLAYDGLARLFARAVEAAGLENPEERRRHFVLHGMRAGSAEASAARGADTPELNRHYRWSQFGTTAQRYAARGRKRQLNPARRIWARKRAAT